MEPLSDEEKAIYDWQLPVRGFGEEGQTRLKNATALISRIGGLGGPVALELAAAGIGKLILAHGGTLKPSDLNRQILMTHASLGQSRVATAKQRLLDLNPRMEIQAVDSNINESNAADLVAQADIVFDCAPLFEERFLMNRECVKQNKPLVDAAMYSLEGQVTTIIPGKTACLQCIFPDIPPTWKRKFPVFGAVSATAAGFATMEGIKVIAGMQPALAGKMLYFDLENMTTRKIPTTRRVDCPICGTL
ncbi:MAG: HesA/MoeB/ThiF family protein [Candidatus Hydrogenedentota bacterium]